MDLSSERMVVKVEGKTFAFNPAGKPLYKTLAINGRGTTVWPCQMQTATGEWTGDKYVIKFLWKEEKRQSEGEILRYIVKKAEGRKEILDYLPTMIASEVFKTISTEGIRKAVNISSAPRELVVSVSLRLDGSIDELEPDELWNVWWDCFECG